MTPNGNLHPIAFHSQTFSAWNPITMSMTKSYSQFLKLSNDGKLPQRLWTSNRCGHRSPEFAILFNDQNPHMSTSTLVRIPSGFNLVIHFHPGKLGPKPTHLLDDGTSILKRGIATMPVSIHRTIAWYSLPSNWHCPSELQPINPVSVYLSSWMLKAPFQHPISTPR